MPRARKNPLIAALDEVFAADWRLAWKRLVHFSQSFVAAAQHHAGQSTLLDLHDQIVVWGVRLRDVEHQWKVMQQRRTIGPIGLGQMTPAQSSLRRAALRLGKDGKSRTRELVRAAAKAGVKRAKKR